MSAPGRIRRWGLIASGTSNGWVRVWSRAERRLVREFCACEGSGRLVFSSGRRLALENMRGRLTFWDPRNGQCLSSFGAQWAQLQGFTGRSSGPDPRRRGPAYLVGYSRLEHICEQVYLYRAPSWKEIAAAEAQGHATGSESPLRSADSPTQTRFYPVASPGRRPRSSQKASAQLIRFTLHLALLLMRS